MADAGTTTRRGMLLLAGGALLHGCTRDRFRVEPVVVGGVPVTPSMTIMEAIEASADHRRLAETLRETRLDVPLSGPGPFTLLAPTDAAFAKIRPKTDAGRLGAERSLLRRTLRTHILPAKVSLADIEAGIVENGGETKALGLNGVAVAFDEDDGRIRVYDTRRRRAFLGPGDAVASNGLIHVLDEVLLLPEEKPKEAPSP